VAKPEESVLPPNRLDRWKKLWATPIKHSDAETEETFDEFVENFVPGHMHKQFKKLFGIPKAAFGNRFFVDEAVYWNWDTRISQLISEGDPVLVDVVYADRDNIEAYRLRGERRRSLRDIVIDDWHAACAIVRAEGNRCFVFVEPKMRGCVVRTIRDSVVD